MLKKFFYILVSLILTLLLTVFQRITGPTYPVKGDLDYNGRNVRYKLPRSCTIKKSECIAYIYKNDVNAYISWKRLGVDEEFKKIYFKSDGNKSIVIIPDDFMPASKIEYDFYVDGKKINLNKIVLRFKNEVRRWILISHIFFMFLSLVICFYLFLEVVFEKKFSSKVFWANYLSMFIGGFVLGALLQKEAFGIFWSGFPFGSDVTDNKVLVSFIFWSYAAYRLLKGFESRKAILISFFITILTYLIPHSF
ncbi:MAG: hypothetical protein ACP5IO_04025 [Elusimicrobiales bacterium]